MYIEVQAHFCGTRLDLEMVVHWPVRATSLLQLGCHATNGWPSGSRCLVGYWSVPYERSTVWGLAPNDTYLGEEGLERGSQSAPHQAAKTSDTIIHKTHHEFKVLGNKLPQVLYILSGPLCVSSRLVADGTVSGSQPGQSHAAHPNNNCCALRHFSGYYLISG